MIDEEKINGSMMSIRESYPYFDGLYKDVIGSYCESMDGIMVDIYNDCIRDDAEPSIQTLTDYYLELANMAYFMNDKVEKLGVMADLAKSSYDAERNKKLLEASSILGENGKPRASAIVVAEAEANSFEQEVVANVYKHAYATVREKVDSVRDMMDTLRRILATRTEELRLSASPSVSQM